MPEVKTGTHRPLPEPLATALADTLRVRRDLARLTQEQVAASAHISVQMVRRLEAGSSNPTLGTLRAVATALGTTVGSLLAEAGL
ncbi:helix-turn-helix domain-containing protein [Nocardioides sp. CCNWLW216]|uniref:helix-turn-helix domain-containing protein n=1 Tax=unclassified Nocardioides TaxID=2615069 RepID=UPI003FA57B2F